jgi:3-hydroxyisobutyrate dehydrogenase-like beta-hydroxyacid dehydrogenase
VAAIGIVGLGLVGSALARRLRRADAEVAGYDIDPSRAAALASLGVTAADSPRALAERCETVIVAVFDTAQLEGVVEGALGVARALPSPRTIVNVVTADPDRVAALAVRLAVRSIALVEAPLAGSSAQIERGEATMLVGGTEEAIEAARGVLALMVPRWHHVGAAGMAARAKLAINLVLGLNRAALAEGIAFSRAIGLDARTFVEVLRDSPAYARVIDTKGERMLGGRFDAEGKLAQHAKDVGIILEQAAAHGRRLPMSEAHAALLARAIAAGDGELDNSAVIRTIESMTGRRTP